MSLKTGFSLAVLLLWLLAVILAPLMDLQPDEIHLQKILLSSDAQSLLGYDDLGRKLFDRLLTGAQTSFIVAFGVILVSLFIGTTIGVISGYVGGGWDHFLVRGLNKVSGEFSLMTLCYNFTRVINILGLDSFREYCEQRKAITV